MHPMEHLLYWSDSLIHLIIPSHPLLVLYHLQVTGTGAVVGHIGFDKIEAVQTAISSHAFAHYLHHKYFDGQLLPRRQGQCAGFGNDSGGVAIPCV